MTLIATDGRTMVRLRLAFALCASMTLVACDNRPDHAEWQKKCVVSHTVMLPMPVVIPTSNGGSVTLIQLTPIESCDRYEPVCVAGKDGSTACGSRTAR